MSPYPIDRMGSLLAFWRIRTAQFKIRLSTVSYSRRVSEPLSLRIFTHQPTTAVYTTATTPLQVPVSIVPQDTHRGSEHLYPPSPLLQPPQSARSMPPTTALPERSVLFFAATAVNHHQYRALPRNTTWPVGITRTNTMGS